MFPDVSNNYSYRKQKPYQATHFYGHLKKNNCNKVLNLDPSFQNLIFYLSFIINNYLIYTQNMLILLSIILLNSPQLVYTCMLILNCLLCYTCKLFLLAHIISIIHRTLFIIQYINFELLSKKNHMILLTETQLLIAYFKLKIISSRFNRRFFIKSNRPVFSTKYVRSLYTMRRLLPSTHFLEHTSVKFELLHIFGTYILLYINTSSTRKKVKLEFACKVYFKFNNG